MSELGMRLKHARNEKNLSLEELQNITKIQKRYLQAIEDGKLELLPGQFYARAFVKSYAEAVGIDPEMLFEEHMNELPVVNKQESEIPPRVQAKKTRGTKKTRRLLALLPTVVAIFLVVTVFFSIWYFLQDDSAGNDTIPNQGQTPAPVEGGRNDDALNPEAPEEEPVPAEEEEVEEVIELPTQELEVVDTIKNETIYRLLHASEFTFKIELQGKSYVGVDNRKGKTFHAANVDSGKTLTFDFSEEETIQFNFGASNNVKLFINDEPFEFPQNIVHQKVTFHFIKEGASN